MDSLLGYDIRNFDLSSFEKDMDEDQVREQAYTFQLADIQLIRNMFEHQLQALVMQEQ